MVQVFVQALISVPDLLRICQAAQDAVKKRISEIEWIVPSRPGQKAIKAVFDKRVRDRVLQRVKKPSQRSESVEGVLEMADFKEQEHKCRIHPAMEKRGGAARP
jgi:hypothetical protein